LIENSNKSFPPRKVKQAQSPDLFSLIKEWPKHLPGSAKLFNQSFRSAAVIYLDNHSRGSLQKAQNDLLSEGKPPTLPPSEPIIPSMLLRRDSGAWTLLLPWSWVTEFWYSFMHYPQSRFGGLTEYAQISFEKHGMAFPEDWPGTIAGDTDGIRMAAQVKEKWNRRQDGKRESWGKVHTTGNGGEVGDPFKCDWNMLFKKEVSAPETSVDGEAGLVESIRNQAKAAMGSSADDNTVQATHFMLSPGYAKQLITRKSPLLSTNDLSAALLPIRLRFLQKGNVSFRARIYRLPEAVEERQKWTNLLSKDESNPSKQDYPRCPGERDLLGFVTTGNMSLSEGRGRAVGALSWARAELEEERWADEKEFGRWCIVRDVGKDIARLAKWEIND
jgi:ribonuclease P/MRP protein subunit POP1